MKQIVVEVEEHVGGGDAGAHYTGPNTDTGFSYFPSAYVQVEHASFCCGVSELGSFTTNGPAKETLPLMEAAIARLLRRGTEVSSSVFATTVKGQEVAAQALANLGFTKVDTFRNANSGNQVTFWFRRKNVRRSTANQAA